MPTVTVDDIQIYYECTGVGPPVFLIHGLGSSTRDWAAQVAALAPTFQIITADLRGHGRSAKPRERYRMARFADDMAGLLRALDATPAHVVGLSLGGMVAFELALNFSDQVRSLVIINSGPEVPVPTLRERLRLIGVYLWRVAVVRLGGMRRMGATLAWHLLPDPEQVALRRTFIDRWAENDPHAYLSALRAIGGWNVTARLTELNCPTLVVAAEDDYTSVVFKQDYTARIPQAELVVMPGSRHLTPLDRPDEINAAMLPFLQKVG
jgi:3-oxoadipate enol-lactonase